MLRKQSAFKTLVLALAILLTQSAWPHVCDNAEVVNFYGADHEKDRYWLPWVAAPYTKIGTNVEHWIPHLSPDYELTKVTGFRSRHQKQPAVSFELQDELSTVEFEVNVATNRHMLQRVETRSKVLLATLGISTDKLDAAESKVWCVCGDATCDSLSLRNSNDGNFLGVWTRAWD